MTFLHDKRPDLVIQPLALTGRCIQLQFASGIRLYDLLVRIKQHPRGPAIQSILLDRCIKRLRDLQVMMLDNADRLATRPYSFDTKVVNLLQTLAELLGVPLRPSVIAELAVMARVWNDFCQIPFRDATPKNIVFGVEALAPIHRPQERNRCLASVLEMGDQFWEQVPIMDIDFTSTHELTVPEDDVISLLAHNSTVGSLEGLGCPARDALLLSPGFEPCADRRDLAWFVRYLRFGGRKLLYKLLNPRGFAVRFRYDEPCFYFEQLPKRLSRGFQTQYPMTFALLQDLRDRAEHYRGFLPSSQAQDHFLSARGSALLTSNRYWQESPLECQNHHE